MMGMSENYESDHGGVGSCSDSGSFAENIFLVCYPLDALES